MAIHILLEKIQNLINDLNTKLGLFNKNNIHPSIDECEDLNKQMSLLQENLSIYKYFKSNSEISPSFNIHAKINEKTFDDKFIDLKTEEIKQPELINSEELKLFEEKQEIINITETKNITIGLNDKFRFIKELFENNTQEFNIAIEQLNTLSNWNETEIYLNHLKKLYNWNSSIEIVNYFYSLIKKRY